MPIVFPSTPYPHTILDTTALADSLFFWVRSLVRGVPTDGGHVPRERRQPGAPHPPRAGVLLQDALQRPHDVLPRVRVHAGLCPKLLLSLHLPVHAHAHAFSSPRPLRTGPRASFHTRHRTIRLSPPPRRLVRAQSPSLTAAPLSLFPQVRPLRGQPVREGHQDGRAGGPRLPHGAPGARQDANRCVLACPSRFSHEAPRRGGTC